MKLPIWATVFIGGLVGGAVGGMLSDLLLLPLFVHRTPESLSHHWMLVVLLSGVGQIAITAGVLLLLLPPLSDVHVGFGTTFTAVLAGNAVSVGGTLLLLHATVRDNLAAGAGVGLMPAFGLFSLLLSVLGIVVTATMIGSADESGGSGGGRLDMYGGQGYLDEVRKNER